MTTKPSDEKQSPFPTSGNHGKAEGSAKRVPVKPDEGALDEGIEESFPASDPVSVNVTKVVMNPEDDGGGTTEVGGKSSK